MKERIIDGVDVAGCEFAVKPINDNRIKCHCAKGLLQIANMQEQPESIKSGLCENNPNCYYKQLKRAEIEIEKLKGVDGSVHPDSAYYKIARLEQENKELKVENERLKKDKIGLHSEIKQLEQENAELKLKKLQQTLQEITEIAEEWMSDYCYLENFKDSEGCCICHENKDCYSYRLLKAITKAEVGE